MDKQLDELLRKYPLISDQVNQTELRILLQQLARQLEGNLQCGAVVELGCYIGTTSLFIRRVLDMYKSTASFYVYDSFTGLPDKTDRDLSPVGEQFRAGELCATRKQFELQFKKAGLQLPIIKKAWFSDLRDQDMPEQICFAYLDGDFYESIRDSLVTVWPRLGSSAVVVVDDYVNEALPGVAKAVDQWVEEHSLQMKIQASLAIIQRQG